MLRVRTEVRGDGKTGPPELEGDARKTSGSIGGKRREGTLEAANEKGGNKRAEAEKAGTEDKSGEVDGSGQRGLAEVDSNHGMESSGQRCMRRKDDLDAGRAAHPRGNRAVEGTSTGGVVQLGLCGKKLRARKEREYGV